MLTLIILATLFTIQAQEPLLPKAARSLVDHSFPGWKYMTHNSEGPLLPSQTLHKCFINSDSIPDYALHIVTDKDSTEHIIALLSDGKSFTLYPLEDHGVDLGAYWHCVTIEPRGQKVVNFGFDDEDNLSDDQQRDLRTVFTTDCITVVLTSKNACASYLFERGKFRRFSSCD